MNPLLLQASYSPRTGAPGARVGRSRSNLQWRHSRPSGEHDADPHNPGSTGPEAQSVVDDLQMNMGGELGDTARRRNERPEHIVGFGG